MKTISIRKALAAMLMMLSPMGVMGQDVTIADWNFENSTDATTWFKDGAPEIAPDECVGDKSNYLLTAQSTNRYWQLCSGWENRVLRIENSDANNISDYSDASQHNVYYEIQFPTKGYKNIKVNFANAYGANAEATLQAVVSTDGGATWVDAGAFTTAPYWWVYNANTVSLSANNKDKVLLRLIAGNGFASNWNMDYITVKGETADGPQVIDVKDFTATWPLNQGTDNATAAEVSTNGLFSVAEFSYGDGLVVQGIRSAGGITETLFQPTEVAGEQSDANAIMFTFTPKKSLTFTPKNLTFNSSRIGTNGGNFDVVVFSGDNAVTIAENERPQLVKEDPFFSTYSYDLSNVPATDGTLVVKIYIRGLATNKQYGFNNIVVTGDVAGTLEAVPTYTMHVRTGTEGAGKVSCNPAGNEFDEGTKITVTATENFGYHFISWTDEEGNEISTNNPYSFEIMANTSLVATYSKKNVYAINLNLEGGANPNLVQLLPEGNVVDGIHHYEEGTDVKLTAINNRILTFTNWSGEYEGTNPELEVKVDGEKNITANFSCADFIVGWDLYNDQPSKDRAADYKSDSENAGVLALRNAEGTTTSWLTRGVNNGQENGKYAARIWKYLSEKWYWEISFSTKGYENIVLSSCIGDDYNTYSVINAEYSIDGGETFTKIGEFNPPSRGWDGPKEFALPADANNQERVYIRWMPDRTSDMVGVTSDYDGTSIAEIFVLADLGALADQEAVLVSSNPENGAIGVSSSGSIILNYDSKIKAGEGHATLDGEEITPIISGKSAIFKYNGLKYATSYTFTMPEGVLTSRNGKPVAATTIEFTTMERTQPEPRLFDAIVALDGSGDYNTVQEAINAAPVGRAKPWLIFIKNGRYNEHVDVPASKTNIHFIGQDRDKTVIYDNRLCGGENAYSVDPGATVVVKGNDTFFENLTLENSYGHEKQAGPQALALNTQADRVALNQVALLSYQDTWITTSKSNNRHYIKNSIIEGAVDFIYNSGNVYMDGDTIEINRPSGGYIVAPSHALDVKWGYVFQNNVIRPRAGVTVTDVWLGRPWHNNPKTVFINTQTFVNIPAAGWYETMGGLPVLWADYNTVDGNGNPVDLSNRRDTYYYTNSDGERVYGKAKNYLTAEEAAQYTIKNVMGGDDNWQPDLLCEECEAPVPVTSGQNITWDAVPYAICYVVTKGEEVVAFTTEPNYGGAEENATYYVQAVNENGGLSVKGKASEYTGVYSLTKKDSTAEPIGYYTIDGRQTSSQQKGLNIVRMSDGTVNKVVVK